MSKILIAICLGFLLFFGSIFLIPMNYIVSSMLKNLNLDIEYSYLEGNIISGKILDLSYDKSFIGDFNYSSEFSFKDITLNFHSIDNNNIEGKAVKAFSDFNNTDSIVIKDLSVSRSLNTDLIKNMNIFLQINELEIKNSKCVDVDGDLRILSQDIKEELFGKLLCLEENQISIELFNKRMKELGNIAISNSKAQVNISTKAINDRRVQLLMEYISFTIDL